MCGIAGFTGKERAVPYLLDCLDKLEYRGYDSAGIALMGEKEIEITRCTGKLSVLTSVIMSKRRSNSACGIGHTRWATHGKPDEKNAHPHLSYKGNFAVVHNGIIENYAEIKNELIKEGITFHSETDTEVIAHLLEKNYEGDFLQAIKKTLPLLNGSYAIAVLCKDCPDSIFCSRWGSPLVLGKNQNGTFVSSDVMSLLKYTDEIYKLDGGESAFIHKNRIEFFDKDMNPTEKEAEKINLNIDSAEKNGFPHFMLKEIFEQEKTVKDTLAEYVKNGDICFPDFEKAEKEIKNINRIVFIGCGSAFHVGMTGKYVTESLTGIYTSAETASEWRYSDSPLDKNCLAVFISQSGETADTLAALRKAREKGALTLSIVNVKGSSLADESELVIHTKAGPEIAVATTKAYTAQLITVYLLAIKIGKSIGKLDENAVDSLIRELISSPQKIACALETLPSVTQKLADEFFTSQHMYFIGRNTDFAAATEGALKMKEVSYIPCEAYAAGELKHGTISLIEKGTPVIAITANNEITSKTLSNIKEVKARGATVIAVAGKENKFLLDYDRIIPVPSSCRHFTALYSGIALQLFAYYTAKNRGCDIDKPRNLAKSVTVE